MDSRVDRERILVRRIAALASLETDPGDFSAQVCALIADFLSASSCEVIRADDARISLDPRLAAVVTTGAMYRESGPHAYVAVPLQAGAAVVGVIVVQRDLRFELDDIEALEAGALYVALRVREFRLEELAMVDSLTGVANRRGFDQRLDIEWRRVGRANSALSIVMIDVDFFKSYNDEYGHLKGDETLRRVAQALAGSIGRSSDVVARYGGEEFAIILPDIELEGAIAVAERMRVAVDALAIEHVASGAGIVTVSAGVATQRPGTDTHPAGLIAAADSALYDAKRRGRHRVAGHDYDSVETPLDRRERRLLPRPLTAFFGRDRERAALRSALEQRRLVTLCGTGGVGKTRLAIEVAREVESAFSSGAFFVDLSSVRDPADVMYAIAATVRARQDDSQDIEEALVRALADRAVLLVVDNCEHVIDVIAHACERMLQSSPGLKIVATSREPLSIDGEQVVRIDALDAEEARALFLDRALSVGMTEASGSVDIEDVDAICAGLDYLPLAIELAAACVRQLPIAAVRARLDDRFALLNSGNRSGLAHQRGLSSLIGWSYDLLSDAERRTLRRSSVFPSMFTTAAALAVVADGEHSEVARERLQALVDKSLLTVRFEFGEQRFMHYESIRAFAAARLREDDEEVETRAKLARFLEAFSARVDRGDPTVEPAHFDDAIIRTVLTWTLVDGKDVPMGRRIAAQLIRCWRDRGAYAEGRRWIAKALENDESGPWAIKLHLGLAICDLEAGLFAQALPGANRALELAIAGDDTTMCLRARNVIGLVYLGTARYDEARAIFLRTLTDARTEGDRLLLGFSLGNLGIVESECFGAFRIARAYFEESVEIFSELGNSLNVAVVSSYMGEMSWHTKAFSDAKHFGTRALEIYEVLDNRGKMLEQRARLAIYALSAGDSEAALRYLERAAPEIGSSVSPRANAYALYACAGFAFARNRYAEAAELYASANYWTEMLSFVPYTLVSDALRTFRVALRARLGHDAFDASMQRGRMATLPDIIQLVRRALNQPVKT